MRGTFIWLINKLIKGNLKTRVIIYCSCIIKAKALAKEKDYYFYYTNISSIEDKARQI